MKSLFLGYHFHFHDDGINNDGAISKNEMIKIVESIGGIAIKSSSKIPKSYYNLVILPFENLQEIPKDFKSQKLNTGGPIYHHKWLLDSISQHKVLDPKLYKI